MVAKVKPARVVVAIFVVMEDDSPGEGTEESLRDESQNTKIEKKTHPCVKQTRKDGAPSFGFGR